MTANTIKDLIRRATKSQFLRFCMVGFSGLAVDSLVLACLLAYTGMGPFLARILSILAAMTNNWALNRIFTFKSSGKRLEEFLRFVAVNGVGALINYAIYSGLLLNFPELSPFIALFVATVCATAFNFIGSKLFAFKS
ncbi:GtrA family protein [Rhodobacteraceae bacterium RKSG542]|uniref:GtrA family protein n=1 Tax=Pseudovibrio flavus TaxID=2529854 RepID=UPI0012BCBEEB|nr:GtrA family protein [Pseudovibrio flavus]MTI19061.1 GtrA family protein [Pseudovibrio flavus]